MLAGFARKLTLPAFRRAGRGLGLTSVLLLASAGSVHDASALGDTRTLSFHHTHSGEDLTVTFKRNGRYDEAALKELNHFLRDWRSQDQTRMDPHLFDILWEVYRDVDGKQPIQIVSAYRSPRTNAMLRRRSRHSGVARFSQHMLGHAMDFYIPGVPLEKIRFAGLRLQRGGVGFYPTSGSPFVHLDTGNIRHWPRMTREQLVRVFPNGRTVHIPSDGKPLSGYQLAMADVEKRRDGDGGTATPGGTPNFLAALFRSKPAEADDEEGEAGASGTPAVAVASAKSLETVPLPRSKPSILTRTIALASADDSMAMAPRPPADVPQKAEQPQFKQPGEAIGGATTAAAASPPQTPADIINSRGFWGNETPPQPAGSRTASTQTAADSERAMLSARQALARAAEAHATQRNAQDTAIADAFQALAYAPAQQALAPAPEHPPVVTASLGFTRGNRSTRSPLAHATADIGAAIIKGRPTRIAISNRLASAGSRDSSVWTRAMILAPNMRTAMLPTAFGDADMMAMRRHFVKPQTVVAMTFTDDGQADMTDERFSGSATASLPTVSFVATTASLR